MRNAARLALAGVLLVGSLTSCLFHPKPHYLSVCVLSNDSVAGDHACERAPQYSDGPEGVGWAGWHYFLDTEPFPQIGTKVDNPLYRLDDQ